MLFGTDGVRGRAKWLLKSGIAVYVARAIATIKPHAVVAVGRDTRQSSPEIERLVVSGLTVSGAKVLKLGVIPTPAVSRLTKFYGADYGVMITASHNPPEYNGIKIFSSDGRKISADEELAIEDVVSCGKFRSGMGDETDVKEAETAYVNETVRLVNADFSSKKVTLDCCHGATAGIAKKVFENLGATVTELCGEKNGELVGVYSGSTNVEYLKGNLKTEIGFAYDGDGDRVIAVSNGQVFDGGKILYILATAKKEKAVCSTVLANGALEVALKKQNVTLYRSAVGDRNLFEVMQNKNINLGAEPSGHIITAESNVGDGILASALFLKHYNGQKTYDEFPSVSKNVFAPKSAITHDGVIAAIAEAEALLGQNGRLLVRPSGTEPVIRVYAEAETDDLAQKAVQKVVNSLQFL